MSQNATAVAEAQNKVDAVATEETAEQKVIIPFEKTGDFYVEELGVIEPKRVYNLIKRIFDVLASFFGLVLLMIPMVFIGIAIKCSTKGCVLFFQERLGLNGKKITIIKFRTMYADAEKNGAQWSEGDSDSRIYPFGRFLRKTRLDELPQLWNVLKNDMSIVGPRPERECFHKEFETYVHGFSERLKVKPGLTGLAQINGGYDLRPEEKVKYDVEYIKNRSLWNDFVIMAKTFGVVFKKAGAK